MVRVDGNAITVETATLTARLEAGTLVSLVCRRDGREHIAARGDLGSPLKLVYPGRGTVDVLGKLASEVTTRQVSPWSAEVRLGGWDADGVLAVSEDRDTGDLLVEPSAYSSATGVLACRWQLPGIAPELELIAPFFQGVRLPLSDPLLQMRWAWPMFWEAGLAILQGSGGGFSIHCQDTAYRYKALHIEGGALGLETEAYGPLSGSRGAGGLVWRLNVHGGDWRGPAARYRDWLFDAYGLEKAESERLPWVDEIRLALSWYGGDPEVLDALAERIDPRKVLIHYSNWRTDAYDENYPTYEPSAHARAVLAKGRAMGFHIMPHCNSVDMDPTHPAYNAIRDFEYRDVQTRTLHGWGWDGESGGVLGVPNSTRALAGNRRRKVMVKVHPGLAMWRALLGEEITRAVQDVGTDCVFIDVTLCSGNLDNCLVENTTSSEGMNRLIRHIASLGAGLAVGGEGLNEITAQGLSFAQAHLFKSWHASVEGLERTGECALNAFLFGKLCRTFGYSRLSGADEDEELRMRMHEKLGAIPTIVVGNAEQVHSPNAGVERALRLATE